MSTSRPTLEVRQTLVAYGKLRVLKEPKTAASRRTIPLEARTVARSRLTGSGSSRRSSLPARRSRTPGLSSPTRSVRPSIPRRTPRRSAARARCGTAKAHAARLAAYLRHGGPGCRRRRALRRRGPWALLPRRHAVDLPTHASRPQGRGREPHRGRDIRLNGGTGQTTGRQQPRSRSHRVPGLRISAGQEVSEGGFEPPRPLQGTRPST